LAYESLEEDAGYPDLLKALEDKLCQVDEVFAKRVQGRKRVSAETERAVNNEIEEFLNEINQTDKQLKGTSESEKQNKNIFGDGGSSKVDGQKNEFAEQLEKRNLAENERRKGNECMKANDYALAVECYGKSLELDPNESFTYANRAMAHIKLKEFSKAIEDTNQAIKLNPDNIKAYHRRGTAYSATNKLELAIRDFQFILEKEKDNKQALKDLQDVRKKLNDKLEKPKQKQDSL